MPRDGLDSFPVAVLERDLRVLDEIASFALRRLGGKPAHKYLTDRRVVDVEFSPFEARLLGDCLGGVGQLGVGFLVIFHVLSRVTCQEHSPVAYSGSCKSDGVMVRMPAT
jgi:hypothetical protein